MSLLLSQRHSALDLLRSFCGDCTGKTKRNGNKKRWKSRGGEEETEEE